jgi:hypothetical protein
MATWRVDEGLAVLIGQWKAEHPGAVVGTIAGGGHTTDPRKTDHAPELAGSAPGADAGEVDAGDFMTGHGVTMDDLADLRADLLRGRDPRLLMIIFQQSIVSSVVSPWKVRTYKGAYHGHLHVSVNDRFDRYTRPWDLGDNVPRDYTMRKLDGSVAELRVGDEDVPGEVQRITRVQAILNAVYGEHLETDGVYGPVTAAAVARVMKGDGARSSSNGAKLYVPEWRRILGVW